MPRVPLRRTEARRFRDARFVELRRKLLAQAELLDLRARHRPVVHKAHVAGNLEGGDPAAAEVDQLLLRARRTAPELHERGGYLDVLRVARADDLDDLDRRMLDEQAFHLGGRDVLTS